MVKLKKRYSELTISWYIVRQNECLAQVLYVLSDPPHPYPPCYHFVIVERTELPDY